MVWRQHRSPKHKSAFRLDLLQRNVIYRSTNHIRESTAAVGSLLPGVSALHEAEAAAELRTGQTGEDELLIVSVTMI